MPDTAAQPEVLRKLQKEVQRRSLHFQRESLDVEKRTVCVALSSENPIERWWGTEILSHEKKAIRTERLKNGLPWLRHHSTRDHCGKLISWTLDSDRVLRGTVRITRNEIGDELLRDIEDEIVTDVSVGYFVHGMVLQESKDGQDIYLIDDWEPIEGSFVPIPADTSVGVGRAQEGVGDPDDQLESERTGAETMPPKKTTTEPPPADPPARAADPTPAPAAPAAPAAPPAAEPQRTASAEAIDEEKRKAREAETGRVRDIYELGRVHSASDLAEEAIKEGRSVDEFRKEVLEKLGKRTPTAKPPSLGMDPTEQRNFSFLKLFRALSMPNDRRAQDAAGLEFEACSAFAEVTGRQPDGQLVPDEVMETGYRSTHRYQKAKRDMEVGTGSKGGYTVDTELMAGSMIEKLENAMVTVRWGARIMRGLVGDVSIPRQSGGATLYWLAEDGTVTESEAAFEQLNFSPRTAGVSIDIRRRLLLQSSVDMEAFLRDEIVLRQALGYDLATLNGSGVSNQPLGILNTTGIGSNSFAGSGDPTWAEAVTLESDVDTANALIGNMAYLCPAGVVGNMKVKAKDAGSGQFVMQDNEVNGYPVLRTGQMPANTLLFGNGADLMQMYWSGVDFVVDPYTNHKSQVLTITGFQDTDFGPRHPESFSKGS